MTVTWQFSYPPTGNFVAVSEQSLVAADSVALSFPLLALAGCALVPGTGTVEEVESTEPAQESGNTQCGDYTAEDALELWSGQVPAERGRWDLAVADVENYDPCAELSWILLTNGEAELDYQVMLFRYGAYLQPAADHSFKRKPAVTRLTDYALKIS